MEKKTRLHRPDVSRDELVPRFKRFGPRARGETTFPRRGDKEASPDVYYWPPRRKKSQAGMQIK